MSFEVVPLRPFEKRLKRLVGKYPSLKKEMAELIAVLEEDPMQGTPLGWDSFKIRIAIASKGKGKSGGARLVTHVRVMAERVFLVTIFDKSEQDALSDKELKNLIEQIPE